MRLQTFASALALAGSATAFSDSWPLVMFSTSQFPDAPSTNTVQTRSQALEQAKDLLSSCPTDNYLLVSQEGINAADLRQMKSVPYLYSAIKRDEIHGKFIVPEVVGESIEKEEIKDYIRTACSQQGKNVEPIFTLLQPLEDDEDGKENLLSWNLNKKWMKDSYTVLFVGTPRPQDKTASAPEAKAAEAEKTIYEPEFIEPVRMDLKRDVTDGLMRRADNGSVIDNRPLFQKYQFFTPGIFMALITAIVLFSILSVGLRALASLEVSYGAFEKDMGPAAQKKQ
ncbi:hypothetical protein NM208_g12826 [Fusarium decemcellulare]|uniref:Uncharacterized protein n=1 Tax=Fusarium decemcellulare TaxID=57161 RepID=A0ACC1RNH9_9HYPO|nr:hypothetical protein NM208_g12826 [Fusarium decemcellulare]